MKRQEPNYYPVGPVEKAVLIFTGLYFGMHIIAALIR